MGGVIVESHLKFANDIVLFTRARFESFQTIRAILTKFTDLSDLQIYSSKSFMAYLKKVHDLKQLGNIFGFLATTFPCTYLKVSLTVCRIKHRDYDFLIVRLHSFIDRWNSKKLSYSG